MSTATISSLGLGSGLELQDILDQLREVDERPINSLQTEKIQAEEQLAEYNVVNGMILTMKSHALALSLESNFLEKDISVSDEDVVTATVVAGASKASNSLEVERLATRSSWQTAGVASASTSAYVPTIQESTTGFASADTPVITTVETMTITYGYGDDIKNINVSLTSGMSLDDIVDEINPDPDVTASTFFQETDNKWYLRIASTVEEPGESHRVMVTDPPTGLSFAAPDATFSYSLGIGDPITISVSADTTISYLADLINDDSDNPGVTASVEDTGFGDNSYRLILISDDSGEDNRIAIDTQLADLTLTEAQGAGYAQTSDNVVKPFTITDPNKWIDFEEDGEGELTAAIATGNYTADELAAAIEDAMQTASDNEAGGEGLGVDYDVSYSSTDKQFTISSSELTSLDLLWSSGTKSAENAAEILGFVDSADDTGATSYTSDNDVVLISIDADNKKIVFKEKLPGGTLSDDLTANIAEANYTSLDDLASAIETAMEVASVNNIDYVVSYDDSTQKFVIEEAGTLEELQILWADEDSTADDILGFASNDTLTPWASSLNAEIKVNGITYQRQSNTGITDIIQGVTLNLESVGTSSVIVSDDTELIKSEIIGLVESFNELVQEIITNSSYAEETEDWGILASSFSVKRLPQELSALMSSIVKTVDSSTSLYDLGVEVNRDGTITLDEDVLDNAISSDYNDVKDLFLGDEDVGVTGLGDLINDTLRDITMSSGLIDSEKDAAQDQINRIEEDIETATERLDKRYEDMARQFAILDVFMSRMQTQSTFIDEMFSAYKAASER